MRRRAFFTNQLVSLESSESSLLSTKSAEFVINKQSFHVLMQQMSGVRNGSILSTKTGMPIQKLLAKKAARGVEDRDGRDNLFDAVLQAFLMVKDSTLQNIFGETDSLEDEAQLLSRCFLSCISFPQPSIGNKIVGGNYATFMG